MQTNLQTFPEIETATVKPLLDSIQLKHGPAAQLGRFFLLANQAANNRGIRLQLHTDLESLIEVNRRMQPFWGAPMVPIFDPAHSDLSPDNSFWISGHDQNGTVVATQAARFLDLTSSSAAAELESMRLFFARPEPHLAAGARCHVACPAAEQVTGHVAYSGGGWYHPKFRGCGLSRILPRISRALAHTLWDTDYTFSVVETVLVEKNVYRSYGYSRHSPSIRLTGSYREDLDLELIWMPREELFDDMAAYARTSAENEVRSTEAADTNTLPLRRQGSSSRS